MCRGAEHVLVYMLEDADYLLLDPNAPWLRRLKGKEKKDAVATLRYLLGLAGRAQEMPEK